jgi:ABC-type transport system involved in multi-copper enzyme maturation permease subunit
MKKDNLIIVILLIYIIAGILYFIQCRSFLNSDITELANDDTLGLFSLMLGDLSRYGNELMSTFIILGIIAVFGFVSALITIPILTSISVSDEYTTRSIQQVTGKGISRFKIVLSKFFGISGFIIILNSIMVAIGGITTIVFVGIGNIPEFIPTIINFDVKFMLINIAFISVCMFCTFAIKNCGFAMPLNFIILFCLIGELSGGLFSAGILKPMSTYILISIVFILGTIFRFNKSDL